MTDDVSADQLAAERDAWEARCHFCGGPSYPWLTDDETWAKVEPILGQSQACFECFGAAWMLLGHNDGEPFRVSVVGTLGRADQLAADGRRTPQEILATGAAWITETELADLVARLEAAEREHDRLVCSWCGDDFEQGDFASTSCCSCDPVSASSLPGLLKDARREAREAIEEGFAAEAALADMRRALGETVTRALDSFGGSNQETNWEDE